MSRDPRVEPRAGDVLESKRHDTHVVREMHRFKVKQVSCGVVYYSMNGSETLRTTIANWRIWRSTATIIHAEGE